MFDHVAGIGPAGVLLAAATRDVGTLTHRSSVVVMVAIVPSLDPN